MYVTLKKCLPEIGEAYLKNDVLFLFERKNGTAFEWYVNEHMPCFFFFIYYDDCFLDAVKAMLYINGNMFDYVYGDKENAEADELKVKFDTDDKELFNLVVILTMNVDGNKIWDTDIRNLV